jgi:hypothetical protein
LRDNGEAAWPRLHAQRYELRFRRMWRFHLAGSMATLVLPPRAAVAAVAVARRCTGRVPRAALNGRGWSAPHNSR